MKAIVNKKEMELPEGITVAELLKQQKIRRGAVWINGTQLLLADYATRRIEEGDQVRLLRIMAGG